jgi:hypothetical protein
VNDLVHRFCAAAERALGSAWGAAASVEDVLVAVVHPSLMGKSRAAQTIATLSRAAQTSGFRGALLIRRRDVSVVARELVDAALRSARAPLRLPAIVTLPDGREFPATVTKLHWTSNGGTDA